MSDRSGQDDITALLNPFRAAASPLRAFLRDLHAKYQGLCDGAIADYIPELTKADPNWFGVCLVTADGQRFEFGDADQLFTIQSISKPFVYGMALADCGREATLKKIGVEPSGDAFNSIELHGLTNRPFNPMINTGAITITAMLHARHGEQTFEHVLECFSTIAGRQLTIDEDVYESERRTGHRNRAIAHLLLNFGVVHDEAEAALDVYFRQCAIQVTARDLAMMGATLANMGCHPITGRSAFSINYVKDILSIMFTCGMYDYSGQWAYRVGVPAKSGVAGGVMAVVNRQLGVGTYSPRLDRFGNSVRGTGVCIDLASRLGLHVFDCVNVGSSFLDAIL